MGKLENVFDPSWIDRHPSHFTSVGARSSGEVQLPCQICSASYTLLNGRDRSNRGLAFAAGLNKMQAMPVQSEDII
jgi:hypothetical protein